MQLLSPFFRKEKELCSHEKARPYRIKAREALLSNDLLKALAYLERGIGVAGDNLELYLLRAQIYQYGMDNCACALKDYRHILRVLERQPNPNLAAKCRKGMRDMMEVCPEPDEQPYL